MLLYSRFLQFTVLIRSVADPGFGAFLTPGSVIRNGYEIRFRILGEQPGSYFRGLGNNFLGFNILTFFDADPGSGMGKIRIRIQGWKKFGSGIRDEHPGCATLPDIVFFSFERWATLWNASGMDTLRAVQDKTSVSDPYPYRIQNLMGQWNRFRIENPDPNPGKPKFSLRKEKKRKFYAWLEGGISWSLNVLWWGFIKLNIISLHRKLLPCRLFLIVS
jgi:hypothetical protein